MPRPRHRPGLLRRPEFEAAPPPSGLLGITGAFGTPPSQASPETIGLLNEIANNPGDVVRGSLTSPFTAAPDIMGLVNAEPGPARSLLNHFIPMGAGGVTSGDPIRESVGLDPRSTPGLLGEFVDPTNAAFKGARGLLTAGREFLSSPGIADGLLAQALFHGTPHRFDRFSLDAIGSGEGAQAFGHGLYFAENPGVARSYQSTIAGSAAGGKRQAVLDAVNVLSGDIDISAARSPDLVQQVIDQMPQELIDEASSLRRSDLGIVPTETASGRGMGELIEDVNSRTEIGHLYEVEIPDEVTAQMLDWDAPLSEQPESVREGIMAAYTGEGRPPTMQGVHPDLFAQMLRDRDLTGQQIYGLFSEGAEGATRGGEAASNALNQAGIPGIRFFDGSSRSAGEGTRNIVLFDPETITQVKRDGDVVFGAARGLLDTASVQPGDTVSGLTVGSDIPNTSSISATLGDDFEEIGLRRIPLPDDAPPGFRHPRDAVELGEQIRASGRIEPLIIVQRPDGTDYVLEGAHRIDALHYLGVDEFPALLVRELD